jgi:hypothetical protein
LDQNPLKDLKLEWVEDCYSISEMGAAMDRLLRLTLPERKKFYEMGKSLKDIFFSPVNDEGMHRFLIN